MPRQNPSQSAPLTDSQIKAQLGFFGGMFGAKEHATIYIVGLIGVLSLIGAISVMVFASESPEKPDFLKALIGIVIAAISFIGGASGRHHDG